MQGGWVLLQNCHLGLHFLDELLGTIIETENVNESCRVWITTEVHPKFPISFLQVPTHYTLITIIIMNTFRPASSLQMSLHKE